MRDADCIFFIVIAIGIGIVIGAFISAIVMDAHHKNITGGRWRG